MTAISRHLRSNLVAYLALFFALGGTSAYAINEWTGANIQDGTLTTADYKNNDIRSEDVRNESATYGGLTTVDIGGLTGDDLFPDSISDGHLQPNSVSGDEVVNNILTGSDVNESTLEEVPSAGVANAAYSTYYDPRIPLPNSLGDPANPIVNIDVPAGSYVIVATLAVANRSPADHQVGQCRLGAAGDFDDKFFTAESWSWLGSSVLTLQVTHTFSSSGEAWLKCTDNGQGAVGAHNTKITATQVRSLSNVPFQR